MLETRPLTNDLTNEYCLERFNDWYEHGFSNMAMPSSGVLMKLKEAFERTTPLPPHKKEFATVVINYCPRCGEELCLHPKFCNECGQAIYWSD